MLFSRRKSQDTSFSPDLLERLFNSEQTQHSEMEEAKIVFLTNELGSGNTQQ